MTTETSAAHRVLTLGIGGETYGIEIMKGGEVSGGMRIPRVPRMPDFVRGVVNLRGRIIPVIDLRIRFGAATVEDTDRTCIVIVQVERDQAPVTIGLIVEEVSEVLALPEDSLDAVPEFGGGLDAGFLLGIGRAGEDVVMVLDIDRVLSAEELAAVRDLG
ncbi:purine-binding chemotaxis protein CheW [bacterium]|nr:purine-binding chemotaxis protein CheW [bacterium]